jgi:rhodanese-related sulfurtransferase
VAEETSTDTDVGPNRAAELLADGAELIDVRREYEWEAGRIEGARHIEINALAGEAEAVPRDRPVIFYCRSGSRSALAAAAFRGAGWDAYNLDGGIEAWVETGHDLDPPSGEIAAPRPGA